MKLTKWSDLKHKASPEKLEAEKQTARAELERMGFGKLRQARQLTQVQLAERLDVPQGAISRMERRTDLLLSTLRQYVEGMGGRLELTAVFPEASFLIDTLAPERKPGQPALRTNAASTSVRASSSRRPTGRKQAA